MRVIHDLSVAAPATGPETLHKLNGLLRRALLALGEAGETDQACRLAAEAWSILRREAPREAQLHNALLHRLTTIIHRKEGQTT